MLNGRKDSTTGEEPLRGARPWFSPSKWFAGLARRKKGGKRSRLILRWRIVDCGWCVRENKCAALKGKRKTEAISKREEKKEMIQQERLRKDLIQSQCDALEDTVGRKERKKGRRGREYLWGSRSLWGD